MKHILPFVLFSILIFTSCNNGSKSNSSLSIAWTPQIDSILHDTVKINPIADSIKLKVLNAENDSTAINWLNELSDNLPGKKGYSAAKEALGKSKEIKCIYTETDALARLGIFYYKQPDYIKADSLYTISLNNSRKYNFKKLESQALFLLGERYRMVDADSTALFYFDKSKGIAKTIGDEKRIAACLEAMGAANFMLDNDSIAMSFLKEALQVSEKIKDKHIQILSMQNMGEIYRFGGKYEDAINYYDQAMHLAYQINSKKEIAYCLSGKGEVFRIQNNAPKALESFNRSLKIYREIEDKNNISFCLKSIGNVYYNQADYVKSLDYLNQSLEILKSLNDNYGISACLRLIGEVYRFQKKYPLAIKYHMEGLDIERKEGNRSGISFSLISIANIYAIQNDSDFIKENINPKERYAKAYECLNESLQLAEKLKNSNKLASTLRSLGQIHFQQKQIPQAIDFGERSLVAAKISLVPDNIAASSDLLYRIYDSVHQPDKALKMYRLYTEMKDSISNEEEIKKFDNIEYHGKEEALRAEQMVKEQSYKAEQEKKEEEIRNQKKLKNVFIGGFLLFGILAFVIFRSLQQNKKAKTIIEQQKKEVENQKILVEVKQKEIIDSISYAKRLQSAILPPLEHIRKNFSDSFVFYRPKDIVAGDFYWMEQADDQVFIAAADSTGHGVPGAMVSVVCCNALNRALKEFGLRDTGKILDKTRELVIETFVHKDSLGAESGEDVKDGMDISIMCIDHKTKKILWSGANNPLWYIDDGKLIEIKGDKQPIGKTEDATSFTTHELEYKYERIFYLITDGYVDQFGGEKGKKFKHKQLQQLLMDCSEKSMSEQKQIVETKFESWIGNLEQVDDVTLIGIKI